MAQLQLNFDGTTQKLPPTSGEPTEAEIQIYRFLLERMKQKKTR